MAEAHAEHAHDSHHVNYFGIFVLLCVCTLLSVIFDVGKDFFSPGTLIALVMAVATCKATFVLLYFMHIRFEAGWKYVLLAPTMVLAVALPFALAPDISFHYYAMIVPQSYVVGHGGGEHGSGAQAIDVHGKAAARTTGAHGANDEHAKDEHAKGDHAEHDHKAESKDKKAKHD